MNTLMKHLQRTRRRNFSILKFLSAVDIGQQLFFPAVGKASQCTAFFEGRQKENTTNENDTRGSNYTQENWDWHNRKSNLPSNPANKTPLVSLPRPNIPALLFTVIPRFHFAIPIAHLRRNRKPCFQTFFIPAQTHDSALISYHASQNHDIPSATVLGCRPIFCARWIYDLENLKHHPKCRRLRYHQRHCLDRNRWRNKPDVTWYAIMLVIMLAQNLNYCYAETNCIQITVHGNFYCYCLKWLRAYDTRQIRTRLGRTMPGDSSLPWWRGWRSLRA